MLDLLALDGEAARLGSTLSQAAAQRPPPAQAAVLRHQRDCGTGAGLRQVSGTIIDREATLGRRAERTAGCSETPTDCVAKSRFERSRQGVWLKTYHDEDNASGRKMRLVQ